MSRILSSLFLLALASPLAALEILPSAPDSGTFIRVWTHGSPCPVYLGSNVAIDGAVITVTPLVAPTPPGSGCGANIVPRLVDVGVLPPGVYTIRVPQPDGFDSAPLIVRDAGAGLLVSPVGGPAEGKRTVQVFGARGSDTVLFDGIPAPAQAQFTPGFIVVTPPPHAPGTVDVTVTGPDGTRKLVAAYTYFDPNAAPDPFVFEPYLFPVAYDGNGTFGSQWLTENRMASGLTLVRFRRSVPAKLCIGDCNGFNWSGILAGQSQSGLLIWVVRRRLPAGTEDEFRVASRVMELSHAHGAGTSLPVGREKDFRSSFTLDGVPIGGNARATLRLWSLAADPHPSVAVTFGTGSVARPPVTLTTVNGVAFAAIDLVPPTPLPRAENATVTVTGIKVWGLLTITDNTTQEVTALWPQ